MNLGAALSGCSRGADLTRALEGLSPECVAFLFLLNDWLIWGGTINCRRPRGQYLL